jgi:hypothetical protein
MPARADADRARSLIANASMFVLSGMIDWRLRRLETAEEEFQRALTMDFGQCEAAHYMGIVRPSGSGAGPAGDRTRHGWRFQ